MPSPLKAVPPETPDARGPSKSFWPRTCFLALALCTFLVAVLVSGSALCAGRPDALRGLCPSRAVSKQVLTVIPLSELLEPPKHLEQRSPQAFLSHWEQSPTHQDQAILVIEPDYSAGLQNPVEREANAVVRASAPSLPSSGVRSPHAVPPPPAASPAPPRASSPIPSSPAASSSGAAPPSSEHGHRPPQWVLDSWKPSRPKNASAAVRDAAPGSWAYEVLDPRPGTLLLSTGLASPGSLHHERLAVLLLKVCGCHPTIFGVVLAAPSAGRMADHFCPMAAARYPAFVNNSVHLAGPVGPHWTLLHPFPTAGSMPVTSGLEAGGSLLEAQELVDSGAASAADVLFLDGYLAWPIERLGREVADGEWRVARASGSAILDGMRAEEHGGVSVHAALTKMIGH